MKILFIGRFQPFHNGHLLSIVSFCSKNDKLTVLIGSKQKSFASENPFTYDERKRMIERSLKEKGFNNFRILGLDDQNSDAKWVKSIEKISGKFDMCYSGNERVISILKKFKKPVKIIERMATNTLSGTEIRRKIQEGKMKNLSLPENTFKTIKSIDGFERIKNIKKTGKRRIFTIGHSTRSITEFITLLKSYGITAVIDIRSVPKSAKNPQFNSESISRALSKTKIQYLPVKEVGGLRSPLMNSKNIFWKNRSFRGYADYMQTPEFENGFKKILNESKKERVYIMCAEILPWKCHRSLVSDYAVLKGFSVTHIINNCQTIEHRLNRHAKITVSNLIYK